MESQLSKPENNGWLADGKFTIADLSFISWAVAGQKLPIDYEKDYPATWKWFKTMLTRPAIREGYKGGPYELKD